MSSRTAEAVRTRHSVRFRLLAIALLPMLVILPLFLGVAMYRWNSRFEGMLRSKADGDLTIAHQFLLKLVDGSEDSLTSLAGSARFRDALSDAADPRELDDLLAQEARRRRLDFLYLADGGGRILASGRPLASPVIGQTRPVLRSALGRRPDAGIDIFSRADLEALSPSLADRAEIPLVPTKRAAPTNRTVETRGMVVHSATPVTMPNGRIAVLVSGTLLNRNLGFIDTINDLVYHDASLPEGSRGTASILLGDVRISTNVRQFSDHRALGTRVSAEVRSAVLEKGRTWLDSAFVVNDWYVSAYEPLIDSSGRRVGMLYVGFLQAPFTAMRREIVLSIFFAFLLVAGLTVPLFLRWAADIFKPLERMAATISEVEGGDLAARTRHDDGKDEIGQVAQHLDTLLDQVQDRDRQLREWNDTLNRRVEERTRSLVLANERVEETTRQLVMSEKLAAIGEITAGVAHEINNPLAVMQGNLEVLRDRMGEGAHSASFEFQLLDEQIQRISAIVTKLLQFARPAEYGGQTEGYQPSEIVASTLPLVDHLLRKTSISVERDDRAMLPIQMNRTELQQVLVNLVVNAIHAMPDGGRLDLRTSDSVGTDDVPGVSIEVEDTGAGMTEDVLAKVFDPFFTTKRRQGNGLGLSISHMLVSRAGGTLSANSAPGRGTVFSIWLPQAGPLADGEQGQTV